MTKNKRYAAVYGAMVALQVREWVSEGRGPPDYKQMRNFVEEAYAVADMSEEVQDFEPELEELVDTQYDGYGVRDNE